jgi:hypothetical protein
MAVRPFQELLPTGRRGVGHGGSWQYFGNRESVASPCHDGSASGFLPTRPEFHGASREGQTLKIGKVSLVVMGS